MKKILTILLCLALAVSVAQQQNKSLVEKPQTLIQSIESGLPAPEILPSPLITPDGTRANITVYISRTSFDADNPGLPVEGYENSSIPDNMIDPIDQPLDALSDNIYFNPGDILPGIQFLATTDRGGFELALLGANYLGNPSKTVVANYFVDGFRIIFDPPVFAAGMDIQDIGGNGWCTVEIYNAGGTLIAADGTAAGTAGVFWGVVSDEAIAEIRILSQGGGAEGADNIAFGTPGSPSEVPLSNYALLISVLLIIGFTMLRYRAK